MHTLYSKHLIYSFFFLLSNKKSVYCVCGAGHQENHSKIWKEVIARKTWLRKPWIIDKAINPPVGVYSGLFKHIHKIQSPFNIPEISL